MENRETLLCFVEWFPSISVMPSASSKPRRHSITTEKIKLDRYLPTSPIHTYTPTHIQMRVHTPTLRHPSLSGTSSLFVSRTAMPWHLAVSVYLSATFTFPCGTVLPIVIIGSLNSIMHVTMARHSESISQIVFPIIRWSSYIMLCSPSNPWRSSSTVLVCSSPLTTEARVLSTVSFSISSEDKLSPLSFWPKSTEPCHSTLCHLKPNSVWRRDYVC